MELKRRGDFQYAKPVKAEEFIEDVKDVIAEEATSDPPKAPERLVNRPTPRSLRAKNLGPKTPSLS